MNTIVYKALENSSCSWICCQCGLPNFSSSLFDSSQSLDHSNSFQPLYQYNDHTTPLLDQAPPNSFKPQKASTPRKPPYDQCTDETSHPRPDCLPRPKKKKKHSITSLLMNFRSFIGCKDVVSNLIGDLADSVGCDVVFGTETWLNDNVLNSELSLDEYHVHRRDRQDKEGGGVFLCIKKHFNSVLIHKSKTLRGSLC